MKKTMLFMAALSLVALQACQKEEDTPVTNVVETGTCGAQGSNLTWTLNADGTLTIRGKGAMEDYDESEPSWTDYDEHISAVVIQDGVTSIGNNAFFQSELTSVTIPGSVASIGESAFYNCINLTSMDIPEGTTSIGAGAFYSCGRLATVTLPESMTSIEESAFYQCRNLTRIAVKAPIPPVLASGAFGGMDASIPVYVPAGSIDAYQNSAWGQYFNNIQPVFF